MPGGAVGAMPHGKRRQDLLKKPACRVSCLNFRGPLPAVPTSRGRRKVMARNFIENKNGFWFLSRRRRNLRSVNEGTQNMSAHSELKKDYLARQHTPWVKRPSAGHLADTKLAAAAVDAIEWLTTVPQETIKVTACNGWLYLEGTLNCRSQLTTVEDVTRHVPGVQGVIDTIKIDDAATQTEATTAIR